MAGRVGVPLAEAEANDETVARGLWRIVASLGTMPDPMGGVVPVAEQLDERTFRLQTERVVREIADGSGGVILGRGAAPRSSSATGPTRCTCAWTAPRSGDWPPRWPAPGARARR